MWRETEVLHVALSSCSPCFSQRRDKELTDLLVEVNVFFCLHFGVSFLSPRLEPGFFCRWKNEELVSIRFCRREKEERDEVSSVLSLRGSLKSRDQNKEDREAVSFKHTKRKKEERLRHGGQRKWSEIERERESIWKRKKSECRAYRAKRKQGASGREKRKNLVTLQAIRWRETRERKEESNPWKTFVDTPLRSSEREKKREKRREKKREIESIASVSLTMEGEKDR